MSKVILKIISFISKNKLQLIAHLIISGFFLFYIFNDNTPPHWDSGRHIYNFSQYKDYLRNILGLNIGGSNKIDAFLYFLTKYYYYPPLHYWLSFPFYYLFSKNLSALLLTNLVWINLLIIAIFRFTKLINFKPKIGFFWVLWIFSSYMIIGQYREYQLDFPNFVATFWVWLSLETLNRDFKLKNIYINTFIISITPLIKWQFLIHSLPLIALYFLKWIWDYYRNKLKLVQIVSYVYIQILSFVTFSGFWYLPNLRLLQIDLTKNSSTQGILEGDPQGFSWESIKYIIQAFTTEYLGLWLILILLLSFVFYIFIIFKKILNLNIQIVIIIIYGYFYGFMVY